MEKWEEDTKVPYHVLFVGLALLFGMIITVVMVTGCSLPLIPSIIVGYFGGMLASLVATIGGVQIIEKIYEKVEKKRAKEEANEKDS
jgi:hypothetical protein